MTCSWNHPVGPLSLAVSMTCTPYQSILASLSPTPSPWLTPNPKCGATFHPHPVSTQAINRGCSVASASLPLPYTPFSIHTLSSKKHHCPLGLGPKFTRPGLTEGNMLGVNPASPQSWWQLLTLRAILRGPQHPFPRGPLVLLVNNTPKATELVLQMLWTSQSFKPSASAYPTHRKDSNPKTMESTAFTMKSVRTKIFYPKHIGRNKSTEFHLSPKRLHLKRAMSSHHIT